MQRVCFVLRIRPGQLDAYKQHHATVWPEMLGALQAAGWRNYSLFSREDGLVVGYLETDDFARALALMDGTDVNARWQDLMQPYFELPDGERPDTVMVPLQEYFHLD
jgi:L-rhamnose mutarotase